MGITSITSAVAEGYTLISITRAGIILRFYYSAFPFHISTMAQAALDPRYHRDRPALHGGYNPSRRIPTLYRAWYLASTENRGTPVPPASECIHRVEELQLLLRAEQENLSTIESTK